jgi:hypothetical protein
MTSTNPAEEFKDDLSNANRIAEALVGALTVCGSEQPVVDVFIDTFADIDRGYFVRNGLVDRRYNPRLGGHVVRNLYSVLNAAAGELTSGQVQEVPSGRICTVLRADELLALVLPERKIFVDHVRSFSPFDGSGGVAKAVDLETGRVIRMPWRRAAADLEFIDGLACAKPMLISFSCSRG